MRAKIFSRVSNQSLFVSKYQGLGLANRLKQVDIDNHFNYSNIVRLHYRKNGVSPSIVYPNPTKGSVTIVVGDKSLIGTEAIVTDVNGRILQKVKIAGSSQSFNLSSYVNGLYLIRLNNKETLKVVKQ